MPQMSPMDWLMLSLFFLFIYFLSLVIIYFLLNLNLKNVQVSKKVNNFFLIW